MFYLTIPLIIALASIAALAFIVWRKMSFLRKMTPEAHEVGDTFVHDLAPEAFQWVRSIPWRQYLHKSLMALEAGLRRLKSGMATVEGVADRFSRSVRKVGQETAKQHEAAIAQREEERAEKERQEEHDLDEIDMDDPEQLKAEEQRLIVAVAQNPKDHQLYSDLARVYMRLRVYADAVEALKQALKLEPGNEQYLRRLERAKRKRDETAASPQS